jgi:5-(carboxyamino)imidazole ribonucleotide synthase
VSSSEVRIGVLGGGQLGRMLALSGIPLGARFGFLDPAADGCAGAVGPVTSVPWEDLDAVRAWAAGFDVITYEFENVPPETLAAAASVVEVAPGPAVLGVACDRLTEKEAFTRIGLEVPPYVAVATAAELSAGLERIGRPAMLKARRGGYDGKGQAVIAAGTDDDAAAAALAEIGRPCLLEQRVAFDAEMSIAVVRDRGGRTEAWPVSRNVHVGGMLAETRGGLAAAHPALAPETVRQATEGVRALAESFEYVGVLAVEFFLAGGRLLANEMAARVHNSFHWTMDFAATGQFENHIRAVAGWPLGATDAPRPTAMLNLAGDVPAVGAVPADGDHRIHRYGKQPRAGRKVGHVNLVADDVGTLEARLDALRGTLVGTLVP